MKLIIGLGNPGSRYQHTWHNIGFVALDQLVRLHCREEIKFNKKFNAEIVVGKIGAERVVLAKPQTFMNLSGQAVRAIAHYYKVTASDVIVIHDELDLPLGTLRISTDASAGGHNGIKSIITEIKSQAFVRVRIGIRTERTTLIGAQDYVLEKIPLLTRRTVTATIKQAVAATEMIATDSLAAAMNTYN